MICNPNPKTLSSQSLPIIVIANLCCHFETKREKCSMQQVKTFLIYNLKITKLVRLFSFFQSTRMIS